MTVLLLLVVRIILVLLVLRLVFRLVAAAVRGYREAAPRGREVKELDMVRDRICDTFLPRSRALVAWVDGREQHFCSAECRDRAQDAGART